MGRYGGRIPAPRRLWLPSRLQVFGVSVALTTLAVAMALAAPVLPDVLPVPRALLPWLRPPRCHTTTVLEVVTVPVVEDAVTQALAGVQGSPLPGGGCLRAQVRAQAPSDTVSGSTVVPPASAPDLWVGDSSLWTEQVHTWRLQPAGSFGSTPVVLVSNTQTVAATGWPGIGPSWVVALDGTRPFAAPRLPTTSAGLLAMEALWQVSGRGETAERRLAAALLSASHDGSPEEQAALRAATRGGPGQPLIASTEQAMLAVNLNSTTPNLTAVYPAEGSPVLDFPIVRIAPELRAPSQQSGTDVIVASLTGPAGRAAARRAGLRDPTGADPPSGVAKTAVRRLAQPEPAQEATFLGRLTQIQGIALSRLRLAARDG